MCKLAKTRNLKIAITSIYEKWTQTFEAWKYSSFFEKIVSKTRTYYSNLKIYNYPTFEELYPIKDFLELGDVVMPTSRMEATFLSNKFRINPRKFFPVPVGVDKDPSKATPEFFVQKYGFKDFVLFVGRIEERKNVLTLLKAWRDVEIPLIIIGHYNYRERAYFEECKKVAERNSNTHFLGHVSSQELFSAYAAAKVFVLPSWCELPGIASLEAGLAGCNLVLTKGGSTTEYFKNYASYANPASTEDIKEKILEAYEKPRDNKLKDHILNSYTWEKTAEKTLEGYDFILSQAPARKRT
jgi:glycosyltransferase involved in cell wall biosynthesis